MNELEKEKKIYVLGGILTIDQFGDMIEYSYQREENKTIEPHPVKAFIDETYWGLNRRLFVSLNYSSKYKQYLNEVYDEEVKVQELLDKIMDSVKNSEIKFISLENQIRKGN